MKYRVLTLGAAMLVTATHALAFHCPLDMKKIDDALAKKPSLSADKMTAVKQLRADGEKLHNAGKHQESVDTLAKAMKLLGIQ